MGFGGGGGGLNANPIGNTYNVWSLNDFFVSFFFLEKDE